MNQAKNTEPSQARSFVLGLQHLLAMYSGAVAVPILIGNALHFSSEQKPCLATVFRQEADRTADEDHGGVGGCGLDIELGAVFLDIAARGLDDERQLGILGHKEEGIAM